MEQKENSKKETYFTDKEFDAVIKETIRGWAPTSVKDIKEKIVTPQQQEKFLNLDVQRSHQLTAAYYLNIKDAPELIREHLIRKATANQNTQQNDLNKSKGVNVNQQIQSIGQNIKNAAKGLNID